MQQETSALPSGIPQKSGNKLVMLFAIAGLLGFTGLSSYLLTQVALAFDASHQSLLSQAGTNKMQGNYAGCIAKAERVLTISPIRRDEAQVLLEECQTAQTSNQIRSQFDKAEQLAANGSYRDAIAQASTIPTDSPFFLAAQQAIERWSNRLLQMAEGCYQMMASCTSDKQIDYAVTIATAIPDHSPVYAKAQQRIQQWQTEQRKNEWSLQAARQALQQNDWETAEQEAAKMTDHPLWQREKLAILQAVQSVAEAEEYAEIERSALQYLENDDLENAIYEAQKLPDVPPWSSKKKMLLEKIQIAVEEAQNQAKWQRRCQRLTDGLLTDCRDLIRDLLGQVPIPALKLPSKLLRKR